LKLRNSGILFRYRAVDSSIRKYNVRTFRYLQNSKAVKKDGAFAILSFGESFSELVNHSGEAARIPLFVLSLAFGICAKKQSIPHLSRDPKLQRSDGRFACSHAASGFFYRQIIEKAVFDYQAAMHREGLNDGVHLREQFRSDNDVFDRIPGNVRQSRFQRIWKGVPFLFAELVDNQISGNGFQESRHVVGRRAPFADRIESFQERFLKHIFRVERIPYSPIDVSV
jgi:hypothetical protein